MSRMDINIERLKELRSKAAYLITAIDDVLEWGNAPAGCEERDEMLVKTVKDMAEETLRYYAWLSEEGGAVGCLEIVLEALQ